MKTTSPVAAPAIGVILPSSNRVVERVTNSIIAAYPGIDACFSRVPYGGHPADGYDGSTFANAAGMLAQARPGIIVWNATRGALLDFEPDRRLCAMITRETGIAATTTALETLALFRARGIRRIGLLQQGDAEEGLRLGDNFGRQGTEVIDRQDLGIRENFEAAAVSADDLARMATTLSLSRPDAILIWSTNLCGHALTAPLTRALGIPVFDSAAIGTLSALQRLGVAKEDLFAPADRIILRQADA